LKVKWCSNLFSASYNSPMTDIFQFNCPTCEAAYKVVGVEAPPEYDRQLICLSCGAPLRNREGKLALKYFLTDDGREVKWNGRKPKL
jgi:hypothetical protein